MQINGTEESKNMQKSEYFFDNSLKKDKVTPIIQAQIDELFEGDWQDFDALGETIEIMTNLLPAAEIQQLITKIAETNGNEIEAIFSYIKNMILTRILGNSKPTDEQRMKMEPVKKRDGTLLKFLNEIGQKCSGSAEKSVKDVIQLIEDGPLDSSSGSILKAQSPTSENRDIFNHLMTGKQIPGEDGESVDLPTLVLKMQDVSATVKLKIIEQIWSNRTQKNQKMKRKNVQRRPLILIHLPEEEIDGKFLRKIRVTMSEMKLRDRHNKQNSDQTKKTNQENDLEVAKQESADIQRKKPTPIGENGQIENKKIESKLAEILFSCCNNKTEEQIQSFSTADTVRPFSPMNPNYIMFTPGKKIYSNIKTLKEAYNISQQDNNIKNQNGGRQFFGSQDQLLNQQSDLPEIYEMPLTNQIQRKINDLIRQQHAETVEDATTLRPGREKSQRIGHTRGQILFFSQQSLEASVKKQQKNDSNGGRVQLIQKQIEIVKREDEALKNEHSEHGYADLVQTYKIDRINTDTGLLAMIEKIQNTNKPTKQNEVNDSFSKKGHYKGSSMFLGDENILIPCKDVQLKYKVDESDIQSVIKPSVTKFINQYKIQYKKEIEDQEKSAALGKEPAGMAPSVKDPPKEVFSLFKIMHNLMAGKHKQVKMRVESKENAADEGIQVEDYSLHAMKYMLDNNLFVIPALRLGFENGKIYDYTTFQKFFDVRYVMQPADLYNLQDKQSALEASGAEKAIPRQKAPESPGSSEPISQNVISYMDEDLDISQVPEISRFGTRLLGHCNNTLLKFFQAYRKTNVSKITRASSLINNLISFSRDQLNQNKGLDLLEAEKHELKKHFDDLKHHSVVAVNVFLYLQRWGIIKGLEQSRGKTFEWDDDAANNIIDETIPTIQPLLTSAAKKTKKPDIKKACSVEANMKHYLLKKFLERYGLIREMLQHPKLIPQYANAIEKYIVDNEPAESPSKKQPVQARPQQPPREPQRIQAAQVQLLPPPADPQSYDVSRSYADQSVINPNDVTIRAWQDNHLGPERNLHLYQASTKSEASTAAGSSHQSQYTMLHVSEASFQANMSVNPDDLSYSTLGTKASLNDTVSTNGTSNASQQTFPKTKNGQSSMAENPLMKGKHIRQISISEESEGQEGESPREAPEPREPGSKIGRGDEIFTNNLASLVQGDDY